MPAQTFSARAVAKLVASRTGKPCDGKRVRAWSRSHLTRFDDDAYTTHAYSAAERDRIVNAMVAARKATATGPAARASSASRGRAGQAATPRKPAKPASVKPNGALAAVMAVKPASVKPASAPSAEGPAS